MAAEPQRVIAVQAAILLAEAQTVIALRLLGRGYSAMVRGGPDIVFFLFFVIALDQGLEFVKSRFVCDDLSASVYQGMEFHVCDAAKIPLSTATPFTYQLYGFSLAVLTFALVFGAFVTHVIYGAMQAVPRAQLAGFARDTASRYAAMPKAALAANKRCIAAATDPARDGYADEISETRTLYDHADTRAKVSDFLAKRAH